MISGRYVDRFSSASHALPEGMHMNADYPFMLPRIVRVNAKMITIQGRDGIGEAEIQVNLKGREWFALEQSSSFEQIYSRPPQKFRFYPFKDENTPAVGDSAEK